jgi:hypothetical protein
MDNLHKVSQINIIFENRIIILIMFDCSIYPRIDYMRIFSHGKKSLRKVNLILEKINSHKARRV